MAISNECPDCASANIIQSKLREQIICRDCGLIFEPFARINIPRDQTITKTVFGQAFPLQAVENSTAAPAHKKPARKAKKK